MVPEKQGLKPGGSKSTGLKADCLSGGSRKTRIETGHKFNGNRDFCVCLSSGSRKTRIETDFLPSG